jgi:hypothetical protein
MKSLVSALLALVALASAAHSASDDTIRVELNIAEAVQSRCRLSFVIENKGDAAVESLKLDLAIFGTDGAIQRRMVTEMGPLRRAKTIVKAFEVESACAQLGSILVNGVTVCAPADADSCLDRLVLGSRIPNLRLFK